MLVGQPIDDGDAMHVRQKVIQSCLITLIALGIFELFSFLFAFGHLQGWSIVTSTSVASTGYVLFAIPHTTTAKYSTVIGGHVAGATAGFLVILAASCVPLDISWVYACGIGLSLLLMTLTHTVHPPAAGTALTIAMVHTSSLWGNMLASIKVAVVVLATVLLLILGHSLLRCRLVNLE
jgi:CBS-domain-containing membrane protein